MSELKPRILIVDDDVNLLETLAMLFEDDFSVVKATSASAGLELVAHTDISLCFIDLSLPDMDGMLLIEMIRARQYRLPVVVLTADDSAQTAVAALKLGAHSYICKPFDPEEIIAVARAALESNSISAQLQSYRQQVDSRQNKPFLGRSTIMKKLFSLIEKVAATDVTVLLSGESGTGKEVAARNIHFSSSRREHPFVAVNCAAIPEKLVESELFGHEKGSFTDAVNRKIGLIECADRGTLFLDEVSELRLDIQAKLLRVLETRSLKRVGGIKELDVDIRLISASNMDLFQAVKDGRFRRDLYYRLNVVPIDIPPLRVRAEDISLLLEHFLAEYNSIFKKNVRRFSSDAVECLERYSWPGNVRELRNIVERSVALAENDVVEVRDLPIDLLASGSVCDHDIPDLSLKRAVMDFEKDYIRNLLSYTSGNRTKAARMMGLHRNALLNKMKRLDISL